MSSPERLEESGSLSDLESELNELKACGADRFDPVRFAFIQALIQRSSQQRESVQLRLAERAHRALSDYRAAWQQAQKQAEQALAESAQQNPQAEQSLRPLYELGDYKAVLRHADGLQLQQQPNTAQLDDLKRLTRDLVSQEAPVDKQAQGPAFDEFLQQREKQILASLVESTAPAADPRDTRNDPLPELKAARLLRQARAQQHAPQLVNLSIEKAPVDPGPLNPQMLAIRALTHMRDLSPHYLNRFVTYLDTLLWLEQDTRQTTSQKTTKKSRKRRDKKAT